MLFRSVIALGIGLMGYHGAADKAENLVDRIAAYVLKLKNRMKT